MLRFELVRSSQFWYFFSQTSSRFERVLEVLYRLDAADPGAPIIIAGCLGRGPGVGGWFCDCCWANCCCCWRPN